MSHEHIMQTTNEIILILLVAYGYMHKDKFIAFEKAVKRIVVGHYRRFKRKLLHRRIDRKVMKINGKISFNKHSA